MKEFDFFGHTLTDSRDECPDCGEPIDNIGLFGSICNNCGGQAISQEGKNESKNKTVE